MATTNTGATPTSAIDKAWNFQNGVLMMTAAELFNLDSVPDFANRIVAELKRLYPGDEVRGGLYREIYPVVVGNGIPYENDVVITLHWLGSDGKFNNLDYHVLRRDIESSAAPLLLRAEIVAEIVRMREDFEADYAKRRWQS